MILSTYTYIYRSERHKKCLLFNSRHNILVEVSDLHFSVLSSNDSNLTEPLLLDEGFTKSEIDFLITNNIIVDDGDDEDYFRNRHLIHLKDTFSKDVLGLVVLPTYSCNFKCPYCYEKDLPPIVMSQQVEDWLMKFIQSKPGKNNIHLCWHGGEPLIATKRIESLLKRFEEDDEINIANHSLVTNGYLLTPETTLLFKKYKLNTLQVTIDGTGEANDITRRHKSGKPTFDVIVKNLDYFVNVVPEWHVTVRVNIHKNNRLEFLKVWNFFHERWGNKNYHIMYKCVNEHDDNCSVECYSNVDNLKFAQDLYFKQGFKSVSFLPKHKKSNCIATYYNSFVIGTNGDLFKCWVDVGKPEKSIGNIRSGIDDPSLFSRYLIGSDMFSDVKCKSCFFFPVCDGGCNATRLNNRQFGHFKEYCPFDPSMIEELIDTIYEVELNKAVAL